MQIQKRDRRARVLVRLEDQLKSGVKTMKKSTSKTALTDSDIKRINKEISILKS
jgi:hypothetical protein